MPELPEVETIRRDLLLLISGRTIMEAWLAPNAARILRNLRPQEFCRALVGRRIQDVTRRGKYLLLPLSGGLTWILHLRLSGSLQHHPRPCRQGPHLRARFRLDDHSWLCYIDLRKLGMMWLVEDPALVVGKLGPEPLRDGLGPEALASALSRRSAPIKAVLLDQRVVAGIGNIYADEALFAAGIDPRRPARSLSREDAARLHRCIRQVLEEALLHRGTTLRDYRDAEGRRGRYQSHLRVFRRTGQPCPSCGTPVQQIKVSGRSTHCCPHCQS